MTITTDSCCNDEDDEACSIVLKADVLKPLLKIQNVDKFTSNKTWPLRSVSRQVN